MNKKIKKLTLLLIISISSIATFVAQPAFADDWPPIIEEEKIRPIDSNRHLYPVYENQPPIVKQPHVLSPKVLCYHAKSVVEEYYEENKDAIINKQEPYYSIYNYLRSDMITKCSALPGYSLESEECKNAKEELNKFIFANTEGIQEKDPETLFKLYDLWLKVELACKVHDPRPIRKPSEAVTVE